MKNLIEKALQAFQEARQRRIDERTLAELDSHTLRDIGLDSAGERARSEALSRRLQFGLY